MSVCQVLYRGNYPFILLFLPIAGRKSNDDKVDSKSSTIITQTDEMYMSFFPKEYLLAIKCSRGGVEQAIEKVKPMIVAVAENAEILRRLGLWKQKTKMASYRRMNSTFADKIYMPSIDRTIWVIFMPDINHVEKGIIHEVLESLRVQIKFAKEMQLIWKVYSSQLMKMAGDIKGLF